MAVMVKIVWFQIVQNVLCVKYALYILVGKTGKINHDNSYQYTGKYSGKCITKTYWSTGAKVDKITGEWRCSVTKMKKLIKKYGAALTVMYAADTGFRNYKKGVFDKCTENVRPNHAVLAIGWGTENGVKYWLLKNSWGTNWGQKGFFKVKQGSCGIGYNCAFASCSKSGNYF